MKLSRPVFNETNYDLVILASMGTFMTWLFGPWWLTAITASLTFGALYLFYKSERKRLDNEMQGPKAEVFDANGTFVGYTTYRIVE